MGRTRDRFPGKQYEEAIILSGSEMPVSVGEITYISGSYFAKDDIGSFNLRHPSVSLPIPDEEHQVFYASTAYSFDKHLPLTSCNGWLLNDLGHMLVVG